MHSHLCPYAPPCFCTSKCTCILLHLPSLCLSYNHLNTFVTLSFLCLKNRNLLRSFNICIFIPSVINTKSEKNIFKNQTVRVFQQLQITLFTSLVIGKMTLLHDHFWVNKLHWATNRLFNSKVILLPKCHEVLVKIFQALFKTLSIPTSTCIYLCIASVGSEPCERLESKECALPNPKLPCELDPTEFRLVFGGKFWPNIGPKGTE